MILIMYLPVFLLLSVGMVCILDLRLFKRRSRISLSKTASDSKRKSVDEKYSKLSLAERVKVTIKNTVSMSGFTMNMFRLFVCIAGVGGFAVGKMLFYDTMLSCAFATLMLCMPYIILRVRSRWYRRNQDELLENSMNLITNSYLGCNDIITAVNDNLDKLDVWEPFAEFITDVTLIDSNIKRALLKLELKIKNKYFSEWIDILVLAQEKSGDYRFILPTVVQSMNDAKRLQIEADTIMMNVWRDYFSAIILAFSIIPLLRWCNSSWFNILVGTVVGKILILLMIVITLVTAFITLRINKPL